MVIVAVAAALVVAIVAIINVLGKVNMKCMN
jgi:hypothetical protein